MYGFDTATRKTLCLYSPPNSPELRLMRTGELKVMTTSVTLAIESVQSEVLCLSAGSLDLNV